MRKDIQRVEAVEGEYGFIWTFWLKDADGSAYTSLAGTETITLSVQQDGGTAFTAGTGSVADKATGELEVAIASTDAAKFDEGLHRAQIQAKGVASVLITNEVEIMIYKRIGNVA